MTDAASSFLLDSPVKLDGQDSRYLVPISAGALSKSSRYRWSWARGRDPLKPSRLFPLRNAFNDPQGKPWDQNGCRSVEQREVDRERVIPGL